MRAFRPLYAAIVIRTYTLRIVLISVGITCMRINLCMYAFVCGTHARIHGFCVFDTCGNNIPGSFIHMHTHTHTHTNKNTHSLPHTRTHAHTHTHTTVLLNHACVYVCRCVCACTHLRMLCTYVCTCLYHVRVHTSM